MNRLGFRHDNLERTLPELAASTQSARRRRLHALRHGRRPGASGLWRSARALRCGTANSCRRLDSRTRAPRRQQRGVAARRARLARLRQARPAALWHRPAAARRHDAAATCHVTPQPYRGGERPARRRGHRLWHSRCLRRSSTIAVVPAGYADGLDLRLAGRGFMLVRGRRAPIVGSVCMDMTMIDVTGMDVAPGDEVVIIGEQGENRSACAKSPPQSGRFRTSFSVASGPGSSGCSLMLVARGSRLSARSLARST